MSRDLILGFVLSVALHLGLFFGDKLFKFKPKPKPVAEAAPKVQIFEMPKLEPEEPDKVITDEEPDKIIELAPPQLMDVPQIVTDTSFVQKMQPPPPENLKPAVGMVVIPSDRDTSRFRNMTVFDPSMLDQQPVPRVQARPQYPFEMRRAGIAGEVTVDFIVDANGDVLNAYALKSSQHEFEASAVQAVSKWKFKAGRKSGANVATHMQVPIVFTLNED
ncbi:MAG: energy transducer TonB [Opitutus sp.]|nr:energy transducer TonB [Opitutus sp.]